VEVQPGRLLLQRIASITRWTLAGARYARGTGGGGRRTQAPVRRRVDMLPAIVLHPLHSPWTHSRGRPPAAASFASQHPIERVHAVTPSGASPAACPGTGRPIAGSAAHPLAPGANRTLALTHFRLARALVSDKLCRRGVAARRRLGAGCHQQPAATRHRRRATATPRYLHRQGVRAPARWRGSATPPPGRTRPRTSCPPPSTSSKRSRSGRA